MQAVYQVTELDRRGNAAERGIFHEMDEVVRVAVAHGFTSPSEDDVPSERVWLNPETGHELFAVTFIADEWMSESVFE